MPRKTASRLAVRASRPVEAYAVLRGPHEQVGEHALQVVGLDRGGAVLLDHPPGLEVRQPRQRAQRVEADRRGMPGRDLGRRARPDDPAGVHDLEPVGQRLGLLEVVRGEQHGRALRRAGRGSAATPRAGSRGPARWWARRASPPRGGPSACRPGRGGAARRRRARAPARRPGPRVAASPATRRPSAGRSPSPRHIRRVSRTVRSPEKPLRCSSTPVCRRTSSRSATGSIPSTCTKPADPTAPDPRSPPAWRSCPAPLVPSRAVIVPAGTSRSTPRTASKLSGPAP